MSKRSFKKKRMSETITKAAGYILLAAGVFLVVSSVILNIIQYSISQEAVKEYKSTLEFSRIEASYESNLQQSGDTSDIADDLSEKNPRYTRVNPAAEKEELYILRIPKIDSENLVREGTSKAVLADALGHEPGTAYIGEGSNCVIAGHRNYSFGKYFNRLNEVEVGDEIFVDAPEGTYAYTVKEIREVTPDQVEILDATDKEQLTLYTCTPIYIATRRLVIIATPSL